MCKSYAINYEKIQYLKPCFNKNLLTFKMPNLWGPKHRTTFGDNSIGLYNLNHWYLVELSCNRVFWHMRNRDVSILQLEMFPKSWLLLFQLGFLQGKDLSRFSNKISAG